MQNASRYTSLELCACSHVYMDVFYALHPGLSCWAVSSMVVAVEYITRVTKCSCLYLACLLQQVSSIWRFLQPIGSATEAICIWSMVLTVEITNTQVVGFPCSCYPNQILCPTLMKHSSHESIHYPLFANFNFFLQACSSNCFQIPPLSLQNLFFLTRFLHSTPLILQHR